jgi:hypothetical protein
VVLKADYFPITISCIPLRRWRGSTTCLEMRVSYVPSVKKSTFVSFSHKQSANSTLVRGKLIIDIKMRFMTSIYTTS